mmetsp:Transcript_24704/g.25125  ORF Transcript_24704/g.25125 Transcript_24704/m.25125 type:complete len:102 (-) Transcript_24704:762-1067(-)
MYSCSSNFPSEKVFVTYDWLIFDNGTNNGSFFRGSPIVHILKFRAFSVIQILFDVLSNGFEIFHFPSNSFRRRMKLIALLRMRTVNLSLSISLRHGVVRAR